jgi:hypothetical protein
MADVPRVRVAGTRMRVLQLAAVFVIPVAAVALALTFRGGESKPPVAVQPQSGSYEADVGAPLSVTAFRVVNRTKSTVTVTRVRVLQREPGLTVIGALAYRGCSDCVADSAVPPHVTPATGDVQAPPLLAVRSIQLKPGAQITLLLSVSMSRTGRVNVPPLRVDVETSSGSSSVETLQGPELCAGTSC